MCPSSSAAPWRIGGGSAVAGGALLLSVAVAACSGGFGPEDSDAVAVHGRVTDAATADPVADAGVDVTAFSGNCGSSIFSTSSTRTDSAGEYSTTVINFSTGFRRCVEVRAEPPEESGLGPATIQVPNVRVSDSGADSLSVDVQLDSLSSG